MKTPLPVVVVGAGGFAREVLDVIEAVNTVRERFKVLGLVSDGPADTNQIESRGYIYLGPIDALSDLRASYVIGIGDGAARERIDDALRSSALEPPVLVHPMATVGTDVTIGRGSVLCAGARVTTNVRLGRHVHLNLNSTVGHDAILGDYVTVNPGATISGGVTIGMASTIGTGAAIIERLAIGDRVIVGAGAAVIRDVPSRQTVVGVPAKSLRTS